MLNLSKSVIFSLAFVCLVGVSGCNNSPTQTTATSLALPGKLSLQRFTALGKKESTASDPVSGIVLDTISNTSSCYLILENIGETEITGIKFANKNSAFRFYPDTISVLESRLKNPVPTIIKLTIIHGTAASGIGYAAVLDTGINIDSVTITGQTMGTSQEQVGASLKTPIQVYAKLVNFDLYHGSTQIDLFSAPYFYSLGGYLNMHNLDPFPVYTIGTDTLFVKNSGNVTFSLKWWTVTASAATFKGEMQISSGTIAKIPNRVSAIEIYAENVIAPSNKFRQNLAGYIQCAFN